MIKDQRSFDTYYIRTMLHCITMTIKWHQLNATRMEINTQYFMVKHQLLDSVCLCMKSKMH